MLTKIIWDDRQARCRHRPTIDDKPSRRTGPDNFSRPVSALA